MRSEQETSARPPRWKWWVWRIVRMVLLVFLGLGIVLYAMQAKLIFPGSASQGQRSSVVHPSDGVEVVRLTTPAGETVVATFGGARWAARPHPEAHQRPTIIFFYGNGMCMADAMLEFDELRMRGFNVIVPEYVGYGMSSGSPSEQGCYATADAAYDYLLSRPDIDPDQIIAMGWSLGAAVAIDLAHRKPIKGVVACSPFTSMTDMGRHALPFMPIGLLLKHRFENDRKIQELTCPIFLAHGRRDSIIPVAMSFRLKELAGAKATEPLIFDEADHNDLFQVGGGNLMDAIATFIENLDRP